MNKPDEMLVPGDSEQGTQKESSDVPALPQTSKSSNNVIQQQVPTDKDVELDLRQGVSVPPLRWKYNTKPVDPGGSEPIDDVKMWEQPLNLPNSAHERMGQNKMVTIQSNTKEIPDRKPEGEVGKRIKKTRGVIAVALAGVMALLAAKAEAQGFNKKDIQYGSKAIPTAGSFGSNQEALSMPPQPDGLNCSDNFENTGPSCWNWVTDTGVNRECTTWDTSDPPNCLNYAMVAHAEGFPEGKYLYTYNTVTIDPGYTILRFHLNYNTQPDDGVVIQASFDGGATWHDVLDTDFVDATLAPTMNNTLSSGQFAYSGVNNHTTILDFRTTIQTGPVAVRWGLVTNSNDITGFGQFDNMERWDRPLNFPVSATAIGQNTMVIVQYNAGESDPRITKRKIYRATAPGGPWTLVKTIMLGDPDDGAWQDNNLTNGVTYYYRAVNADSQSPENESAPADTGPVTPNCIVDSAIEDPGKVPQRGASNRASLTLAHVVKSGGGGANVTWTQGTAVVPCGGPVSNVDGYRIGTKDSAGGAWSYQYVSGTTTSFPWGGNPAPGQAEYFTADANEGTIWGE